MQAVNKTNQIQSVLSVAAVKPGVYLVSLRGLATQNLIKIIKE